MNPLYLKIKSSIFHLFSILSHSHQGCAHHITSSTTCHVLAQHSCLHCWACCQLALPRAVPAAARCPRNTGTNTADIDSCPPTGGGESQCRAAGHLHPPLRFTNMGCRPSRLRKRLQKTHVKAMQLLLVL